MMPVPRKQLSRLAKELSGHERRIAELQDSIRLQREEIQLHESVVRLGRDARLLAALGELHDEPELFQKISADLRGHFTRKGVDVPRNAEMLVFGTRLEARFGEGTYKYKVVWDRAEGFSLQVASAPPRPAETVPPSEGR